MAASSSSPVDWGAALAAWLPQQRWFGGKARQIARVHLGQQFPFDGCWLVVARVDYVDSGAEDYLVPLRKDPSAGLADAFATGDFAAAALRWIGQGRRLTVDSTALVGTPTSRISPQAVAELAEQWRAIEGEQTNTSLVYGDRLILKLFRKLENGLSPDLELTAHLTERVGFRHTAALAGAIELCEPGREPRTVAMLQEFVPNRGNAWSVALGELAVLQSRYGALAPPTAEPPRSASARDWFAPPDAEPVVPQPLAAAAAWARLLGRRTGELHLALADDRGDERFAPQPITLADQQRLAESASALLHRALALLVRRRPTLSAADAALADEVVAAEPRLLARLASFAGQPIAAQRIRCHGDYHLGQVLATDDDFVIIDFEGEPARSLAERREKHSPLRDVAGMLRSFDYAQAVARRAAPLAGGTAAAAWSELWHGVSRRAFLAGYLGATRGTPLLPPADRPEQLMALAEVYVLEKAIYELSYELNNRPTWVSIPLAAVAALAGQTA